MYDDRRTIVGEACGMQGFECGLIDVRRVGFPGLVDERNGVVGVGKVRNERIFGVGKFVRGVVL